jgi:hypothetical protein
MVDSSANSRLIPSTPYDPTPPMVDWKIVPLPGAVCHCSQAPASRISPDGRKFA